MRLVLTFMLALLVLAAGVVPLFGAHPVAAKDRHACCKTPRAATGCEGKSRPMPCCTMRPAPAPTAALPPSAARAEAPAQAHLHLPAQMPSPATFQPAGLASVSPHDLASLSEPLRLYLLHSAYLI
ncbi:MAG: hypothetical protein A3F84_14420 [Candidatus Handelsmanbacteria bacterium RIFCSPLOWO2_12_FULL_64_10]|uniref:Uncharacterized protein n=1 Tax=Handelsmanbacteria sp. (strain RIFCSPLOWO2_12_FULL_64_10) TaxID=1817868 RepID=A0A1F6CPQ2_HANXR|nr:MAG: hypothetical protein A3F84_14420 [Candidatus Handelsmanbacteria bacterium RIFCSPLOWO2_12_FULL_64_10]